MVNGDMQGLDDIFSGENLGWVLRRAKEMALVCGVEKFGEAASKFSILTQQAGDCDQIQGNHDIYARSGRLLRAAEQLQLAILNCLQNKKK